MVEVDAKDDYYDMDRILTNSLFADDGIWYVVYIQQDSLMGVEHVITFVWWYSIFTTVYDDFNFDSVLKVYQSLENCIFCRRIFCVLEEILSTRSLQCRLVLGNLIYILL